jgi:hypothetical protein
MPTFDNYWNGDTLAVIQSSSTEWQPALRQQWLEIVSQSFEVYFNARNNLKRCTDSRRRRALQDNLESCAYEGCSRFLTGVLGLQEAFEHLVKTNGRWCDPIGTYQLMPFYHQQEWSVYKPYWTHGHRAGVRFMEAFDNKTKEGIDALVKFQSQAQKLASLNEKTGRAEKLSAGESRSVVEILKSIHEVSEKVEDALWWIAKFEDIAEVAKVSGKIKEFAEKVEKCAHYVEIFNKPVAEAFSKATSVTDKIGDACDNYKRAKETNPNLSDGEAASIAVLQKAMEYVPIFGTLYAEVIGGIPNTTEMVQRRANELNDAMQRLF